MKLRNTIFTLIILLYSFGLVANIKTDSLLIELRNTQKNKDKILLINRLSRTFIDSNLDSSIYYAKQGLHMATEIDYTLGIAENAASLGDYYIIYDSLNKAKLFYINAGKAFLELDMFFDYAELSMVLGNIYLTQNNYPTCIQQ